MKVLLSLFAFAVCLTAQAQSPGATKGPHRADLSDVLAATQFLPDPQRKKILDDPEQWKPVLDEALIIKEWLSSDQRRNLSEAELAGLRYQANAADLRAGIDAYIARALRDLLSRPEDLDLRAREIWKADTTRFFRQESADIVLLFIDSWKRGLANATARFREIQRQLKRGKKLEELVKQYADIVPGQSVVLNPRTRVEKRSIEGAAKRVIFEEMKEGEVRGPIPTPEGWLVVHLIKKNAREKLPYDEVGHVIKQQILEETAQIARLSLMNKLVEVNIVFDEALSPPQPSQERRRAVIQSYEVVQRELKERKITQEQVQARMIELMTIFENSQKQ